jgi:hypothetical protein
MRWKEINRMELPTNIAPKTFQSLPGIWTDYLFFATKYGPYVGRALLPRSEGCSLISNETLIRSEGG